jgi:hypothetical protein
MFSLRLYLDGYGRPWALVQCERCNEVHKYPAEQALATSIACLHCGARMDVGESLLTQLTANAKAFDREGSGDERQAS